jgi:D-tyrosyl-tRNA(Tyr) deacylase
LAWHSGWHCITLFDWQNRPVRVVIQRVREASVNVDGAVVGAIGPGLCLLVGVASDDGEPDVTAIVEKTIGLRIFADDDGKMNLCLADIGGEVLVVSQFTLLSDVRRGRRPSFTSAAPPQVAAPLIETMISGFGDRGVSTASGVFGADMDVSLVNDGPVTLVLEVRGGRLV